VAKATGRIRAAINASRLSLSFERQRSSICNQSLAADNPGAQRGRQQACSRSRPTSRPVVFA
jgi:hypothetical protein